MISRKKRRDRIKKGGTRARLAEAPVGYPYRCFLPDLAGFGNRRRSGPGLQSHKRAAGPTARPRIDFLASAGWRVRVGCMKPGSSATFLFQPTGQKKKSGGERGIRTLGTPCERTRTFQARSFNHSDISPLARPARFERAAFGPAIRRSIQLSYGRLIHY